MEAFKRGLLALAVVATVVVGGLLGATTLNYSNLRATSGLPVYTVQNSTGGDLSAGTLVGFTGWDGTTKLAKIGKADSATQPAACVLTATVTNGTAGTCATYFLLTAQNTAGFAVGDRVYLDTGANAGKWTHTAPTASNLLSQAVGFVDTVDVAAGKIIFTFDQFRMFGESTFGSGQLQAGAVGTTALADLGVATGKIADLGVTTGKLADGAVTSPKVAGQALPTWVAGANTYTIAVPTTVAIKIADAATDATWTPPRGFQLLDAVYYCTNAAGCGAGDTVTVKSGASTIAATATLGALDTPVKPGTITHSIVFDGTSILHVVTTKAGHSDCVVVLTAVPVS